MWHCWSRHHRRGSLCDLADLVTTHVGHYITLLTKAPPMKAIMWTIRIKSLDYKIRGTNYFSLAWISLALPECSFPKSLLQGVLPYGTWGRLWLLGSSRAWRRKAEVPERSPSPPRRPRRLANELQAPCAWLTSPAPPRGSAPLPLRRTPAHVLVKAYMSTTGCLRLKSNGSSSRGKACPTVWPPSVHFTNKTGSTSLNTAPGFLCD